MDLPFTSSKIKKELYISQKHDKGFSFLKYFLSPCTRGRHIHVHEAKQEILIYGRSYNNNKENFRLSQHIRPNFISIFYFRLCFTSIIRASKQSVF